MEKTKKNIEESIYSRLKNVAREMKRPVQEVLKYYAQALIYQMLQGSLTLLEKTSKHPGELKWQIASPQGTTIAGLKTLEELAIRGGIINTFLSAYDRANKLSLLDLNSRIE